MIEYVLGFAFVGGDALVLIQKSRPAEQVGLFNGVGGKVERTDASAAHAMVREFAEEAGALTAPSDWEHFASLRGDDSANSGVQEGRRYGYVVYCYRAFFDQLPVRTMTDEPVVVCPLHVLGRLAVKKELHYLIPMALDRSLNAAALQYEPVIQQQEEKKIVGG